MKKSSIAILLLVNGGCFYSVWVVPYLYTYYYNAMQEAYLLSNSALGLLATITGVTALFGYFFGGIIADLFPPKKLLISSYAIIAVTMLVYATSPPYSGIIALQIVASLASVGLYFGAMAKYVRSLGDGDTEKEGRLYGLHFACCGIGGTILGFAGAGLIAEFGSADGLKAVFILNAAYLTFAIVVNYFLYQPKQVEIAEGDKFKFNYIPIVIKMPLIWLVGIMNLGMFLCCAFLVYFPPLLHSNYGVPLGVVSLIGTFKLCLARAIFAPVGGLVIDKVGSSVKVVRNLLICALLLVIATILLPRTNDMLVIAVIICVVIASVGNMSVPAWITPISEIGVPDRMRGTATGLHATIYYSTDAFIYSLGGYWLDKYGDVTGYTILFSFIAALMVVGIIAGTIAHGMLKKGQRVSVT